MARNGGKNGATGTLDRFLVGLLSGVVALMIGATVLAPINPESSAPRPVIPHVKTVSLWGDDAIQRNTSGGLAGDHRDLELSVIDLVDAYGMTDLIPVPLETLRDGIPPLFGRQLPPGLGRVTDTTLRRSLFLYTLLPLAIDENQQLARDRQNLWRLQVAQRQGRELAPLDHLWLAGMTRRYGVEDGEIAALFKRLDQVPLAPVLAMAARTSDWGRRQPLFPMPTAGKSLRRAIRDYLLHINVHPRFQNFRDRRAGARQRGEPVAADWLIGAFDGGKVVRHGLARIIRDHGLEQVDRLTLMSESAF